MIKIFKYVFSFYVLLTSTFMQLHAHSLTENTISQSQALATFSDDSDSFIDTYFSSNTNQDQDQEIVVIIENEVNDNDTKSQKYKLGKFFSDISIFNYRDATIVLREINNELPSYSYFEEVFKSWYKLYQVFRI